MNTIKELFEDLDSGLVHLKTEHRGLRANVRYTGGTPGPDVFRLNEMRADILLISHDGTAYLKVLGAVPGGVPWDKDITAGLAHNANCPGSLADGWWQRTPGQITGLTFHHTCSDSPHALASWYVNKEGGRPSLPYTIWITQTGETLLCDRLEEGCYHDHTGFENSNLSVGLAGRLHEYHPAAVQLQAAARVAAWAILDHKLSITLGTVRGHMDVGAYAGKTQCPGWASDASGNWKPELYQLIEELL